MPSYQRTCVSEGAEWQKIPQHRLGVAIKSHNAPRIFYTGCDGLSVSLWGYQFLRGLSSCDGDMPGILAHRSHHVAMRLIDPPRATTPVHVSISDKVVQEAQGRLETKVRVTRFTTSRGKICSSDTAGPGILGMNLHKYRQCSNYISGISGLTNCSVVATGSAPSRVSPTGINSLSISSMQPLR